MNRQLFTAENRKWWTLAAVTFGLFMIMMDNTVVNVALPSIRESLLTEKISWTWIFFIQFARKTPVIQSNDDLNLNPNHTLTPQTTLPITPTPPANKRPADSDNNSSKRLKK